MNKATFPVTCLFKGAPTFCVDVCPVNEIVAMEIVRCYNKSSQYNVRFWLKDTIDCKLQRELLYIIRPTDELILTSLDSPLDKLFGFLENEKRIWQNVSNNVIKKN